MSLYVTGIALIAGLGNPGPRYDQTRHNAGFWFLDALARQNGGDFRMENKFSGETCRITIQGRDCRLLKPMTFMNKSGQSLRALATFFRIEPESVLVVHDELDLEPGIARLKRGGGHGGHNGLRDIHAQLGDKNYARLRIGVGHPGHKDQVVDYVLSRAPRDEQDAIEGAIDSALRVAPALISGDWDGAVRELHSELK
ncbi:MAG: aminoacyl-tRNA hydrolase [Gammaproteobacteria bacterium]